MILLSSGVLDCWGARTNRRRCRGRSLDEVDENGILTRAGTAHAFRFIFVTTGLLTLVRYSKGNLFDCLGLLEAASELTLALAGCTSGLFGTTLASFKMALTLVSLKEQLLWRS